MKTDFLQRLYRAGIHFSFGKKKVYVPFVCGAWAVCTFFILAAFFYTIELKPKVDENFFFSSEDPQFREDRFIYEIFPQPSQLIVGAAGDIRSAEYAAKIRELSEKFLALPEVFSVQSLTHGPEDLEDALTSPLWNRVLLARDGQSTFVSVFIREGPLEGIILKAEAIVGEMTRPDFRLMISGPPYIVEKIQRNLLRDFKVFSGAALFVFGFFLLVIFRSWRMLWGTLISCANASASTILLARLFKIPIGPLTANLSTIVFVLTLSHIVFLSFNLKYAAERAGQDAGAAILKAARVTVGASFWSMATTFVGFASLLFVQATPLRQLGISGAFGTLLSFFAAYLIYPWFLKPDGALKSGGTRLQDFLDRASAWAGGKKSWFVAGLGALAVFSVFGLVKINTDPDLLAYFKKGSELREGLEYIDRNGGSSPLKIVVADQKNRKFNSGKSYRRLWELHRALERVPSVGNVVSLPVVLAEARRSPLTFLISTEWLLKIMESRRFGEIARYFVTKDRERTLFVLVMKETGRRESRLRVVEQIKGIVYEKGFSPVLVGGSYLLQGALSQLLASSIISSILMLIGLFAVMGWGLSRSVRVSGAMLAGLCLIPANMLGLLGYLDVPVDVISAPAVNLAIGMGVDSMIHMVFCVRRLLKEGARPGGVWDQAYLQLWKPVFSSAALVSAGFGIFGLSIFPPTQRFGFSIVLGALIAPFAALFVMPWFAQPKPRPAVF